MSKPLSDRVAIVTGASSGIGAAVAAALASSGARVAMAARREDKLHELEKRISDEGGVAISVKTDILVRQQVTRLSAYLFFSSFSLLFNPCLFLSSFCLLHYGFFFVCLFSCFFVCLFVWVWFFCFFYHFLIFSLLCLLGCKYLMPTDTVDTCSTSHCWLDSRFDVPFTFTSVFFFLLFFFFFFFWYENSYLGLFSCCRFCCCCFHVLLLFCFLAQYCMIWGRELTMVPQNKGKRRTQNCDSYNLFLILTADADTMQIYHAWITY